MKKITKFFDHLKLKNHKNRAFHDILNHNKLPQGLDIYKKSHQTLHQSFLDIKHDYQNIALLGSCPHYFLQKLQKTKFAPKQLFIYDVAEKSLQYSQKKIVQNKALSQTLKNTKVMYKILDAQTWHHQNSQLDLIISSLSLHNVNNLYQYMIKQLNSLKPDGTLIGTTFGKQTLQQLRISFILAENERYGGISPHISPFIEIDALGNIMGHCNFQMPTIISKKYEYLFENPIDLIDYFKQIGENSTLIGSRKGIYKDLFLSMLSIYSNRFSVPIQNQNYIIATCEIISYIGWKYSQTQKQPLKRGSRPVNFDTLVSEISQEGQVEFGELVDDD